MNAGSCGFHLCMFQHLNVRLSLHVPLHCLELQINDFVFNQYEQLHNEYIATRSLIPKVPRVPEPYILNPRP